MLSNPSQQSTLKYDILRLLISLSSSLNQNYTYVPRLSHILQNKTLTWEDVIKDDPLEGDHWRQWSDEMSSENSDTSDHMDGYESEEDKGNNYSEPEPNMSLHHYHRYHPIALDTRSDQDGLSHLMTQQYWLDDSALPEEESAGDTLLQSPCQMSHVLGKLLYHQAQRSQLKAITEANMVREILFLLRGFSSVVFTQDDNGQFVVIR